MRGGFHATEYSTNDCPFSLAGARLIRRFGPADDWHRRCRFASGRRRAAAICSHRWFGTRSRWSLASGRRYRIGQGGGGWDLYEKGEGDPLQHGRQGNRRDDNLHRNSRPEKKRITLVVRRKRIGASRAAKDEMAICPVAIVPAARSGMGASPRWTGAASIPLPGRAASDGRLAQFN